MSSVATPLKYAGTITDTSGNVPAIWTNLNNAKLLDGAVALYADGTGAAWSHGSGAAIALSNYGFALPTSAIIDGIQIVATEGGSLITAAASLLNITGGAAKSLNVAAGVSALGGPTDLWGASSITAAQVNSSSFGVSMVATNTHDPADANFFVDAVSIVVSYHLGGSTTPADVPIRELYKVYNQQGQYLGLLPQPDAPFKIAQDINSLGSQVTIKVPISADVSSLPAEAYTTEDASANYTNEAATDNYTTEGALPIVSAAFQGIDTLIKNGNTVQVWLYNYFYPNGKCMFIGKMRRWEADFGGGGGSDEVTIVLYSSGYDMDNYITRGAPFAYTLDQNQPTYNNTDTIFYQGDKGAGWHLDGQTFKVGAGVTNVGSINVALNGTATVTVDLYDAVAGGNHLGSVTQNVSTGVPTSIGFGFPNLIPVTPGNTYFFTVTPAAGQSIGIGYQSTNPYAAGSMYTSDYSGGSGGGAWGPSTGNDLWFQTSSGTPSTAATFSTTDPSTGMLAPIITDYNLRGGSQGWTVASIDATGLSLTYRFNVQTVYEALQAILSLSPFGFYYYIDMGTQTIYFKNASKTAEFTFIKGVHIAKLTLITTTENSVNTLLFTGGDPGTGIPLYKQYSSNQSITALGPLLDRKTDSRVTLAPTADAIGTSEIAELNGEQYQTTIRILHTQRLDITLLVPGKVIGFRGFGTFVDLILAQIVHREWTAEYVDLTLGVLPKRLSTEVEQTTRSLTATQTTDNPSTPS